MWDRSENPLPAFFYLFLVLPFPPSLCFQCTLSMVKGLVFKGPRGYNMLAEVDYFYPLPDSVEALKPKRTKLKAVPVTAPQPPPPPPVTTPLPFHPIDDGIEDNHILFNHHEHEQLPQYPHHPDLFIPDSGWRNDPNLAHLPGVPLGQEVPAAAVLKRRVWSHQNTVQLRMDLLNRRITPNNIALNLNFSTSTRNNSSSSSSNP